MAYWQAKGYPYKQLQKQKKYHNVEWEIDGITFDSKRESLRYQELKLLERAHQIINLRLQVPFELLPTQRDENGKVIEKKCTYIADFVYEENGKTIVEDVKGIHTEKYLLKRKMMLYFHGIRIREV